MSDNRSTALWNLAVVVGCDGEGGQISEWHLTVQTSTTSPGADSPRAHSRLFGGSDDPEMYWLSASHMSQFVTIVTIGNPSTSTKD